MHCFRQMLRWVKRAERNRKSGAILKRFDEDMNVLGSLQRAQRNIGIVVRDAHTCIFKDLLLQKAITDAQYLASIGRKIVECCVKETDRIIAALREQVTAGVYHSPDKRENEKVNY